MWTLWSHPSLKSKEAKYSLFLIVFFRFIFAAVLLYSLSYVIQPGTSPYLLCCSAFTGILAGTVLAFSRLAHRGLFLLITSLVLTYRIAIAVLERYSEQLTAGVFTIYTFSLHADLVLTIFTAALILTWLFWKFEQTLTVEVLTVITSIVYLFSGHREFHFDMPKIVNTLAWNLQVNNLTMLVIIGVTGTMLVTAYIYIATLPGRPRATFKAIPVYVHSGKRRTLLLLSSLIAVGAVIYLVAQGVYQHYNIAALTRTANGVGQDNEEGMSPLGFHSALGSTNQPAALVRLEGDYKENPFIPMLYLRESALSEYNGHEMVIASREFDRDITRTSPEQSFKKDYDPALGTRTPLVQSVYLLTDHNNAFAVDYPITIKRLKNPNPSRFKAAYRAYSMAPAFTLESLEKMSVGNPNWDQKTREHYLKTNPDPRYHELAKKLTEGLSSPIEKALSIVNYLNKHAIYTLTPNHDVDPNSDQTAPFLFGDLRGYCVHFAHATVYMLRSLGIPARIGTGYLTDLSQAKDGHILLRMSDRHAWAEVYITNQGWVPFDTQPEHVESHADSPVDMNLLEELMSMLEPDQEILPDNTLDNEKGVQKPKGFYLPEPKHILLPVALIFLVIALIKLYLRLSWLIPAQPATVLKRSYRALMASLIDLGLPRKRGETRREYSKRIS
ncbi:MAG: hypothetical protein D6719_08685, partial [Candidatus Dadabacteria bacterium]